MKPIREFEHNGKTLQISVRLEGGWWKVRLLENGRPRSPVVYGVSHETAADAAMQDVPVNLVEQLIGLMKHDVIEGILPLG